MGLAAIFNTWRKRLRAFGAAQGGNVVLTFTLLIVPVIGFVGVAVDYSRANAVKAAMQMAIDSTALMLSKDAQSDSSAQLTTKANAYFNALFNRPLEATSVVITPTYTAPTQGSFKIEVVATARVPTTFTKVLGKTALDVDVRSEVLWGTKRLEIALALDNTGSMAFSNKMSNLKTAAHNLLTTLRNASKTAGDIKVAIIPFDTTVNLGVGYVNNSWFDTDSIGCNGKAGNGCNSTAWKNHWEGCVRDRTYPYDTQDNPPDASVLGTLFPVYECGSLTSLMPLSYDWTALNSKIDAMSPNGTTNVTIGLVWAWHALTAQAPLSEAAAPASDLDKVLILLTDGDNTESWKNSNHTTVTTSSAINDRTSLACTNIKAGGIKVYTIRVIDGNATLLRSCATNSSMYYEVQQASELDAVFAAIAQNLSNLRIAK